MILLCAQSLLAMCLTRAMGALREGV